MMLKHLNFRNRINNKSKIVYPVSFNGTFRELEKIRGFKKFIVNFCRTLGDIINSKILTEDEIELLYLNISRDIRICLATNGGDKMTVLDQIVNEMPKELSEGDKIIDFFRKMQLEENKKNEKFWENPEFSGVLIRLKSSEYIMKVKIDSLGNPKICCLSKDLLGDTFHMTLFSMDGHGDDIQLIQKTKIKIYDDLNGDRPAKSKDIITKFVVKLKEVMNRFK